MKKYLVLLFLLTYLFSCQTTKYPNFSQITTSNEGIVSSAQPLATLAGKEMLAQGGNAVDAAVATGFALAVVEPSMSGLGGRLQAIVRLPNGELHGFDATTQAPMRYDTATTPDVRYGYDVVGIPGVPAGLIKMQKELGKLPLSTVIQPAIRYAKNGFKLLPGEVLREQKEVEKLKEFAGSTQYFLKNGKARTTKDKFVQSDLAKVLERIAAQGHDGFYKGETAQKMAADVQA
ncbi:MAG: gamma-glutamyltransferase, partial [Saprospiraceae bacterium]